MKKNAVSSQANGLAATDGMPMADLAVIEQASADVIRSRIFTIRGVQVMLAPDLADLYQVETRSFNQSVKRNLKRFPGNFRFQLTRAELEEVITNCDNPDRLRFSPQLPFAFTEQGLGQVPRPLPHHRQDNPHPRRRVAKPPRQEVLRVLVARQVQHSRHPGEDMTRRRLSMALAPLSFWCRERR